MPTTITVGACCDCPFFVQTALSVLSVVFNMRGEDRLVGECDCPSESGLRHHKIGAIETPGVRANRDRQIRRLKILDGNSLPPNCPLKSSERVIKVG